MEAVTGEWGTEEIGAVEVKNVVQPTKSPLMHKHPVREKETDIEREFISSGSLTKCPNNCHWHMHKPGLNQALNQVFHVGTRSQLFESPLVAQVISPYENKGDKHLDKFGR